TVPAMRWPIRMIRTTSPCSTSPFAGTPTSSSIVFASRSRMPISDGRNQARVVIDTNVCLDLFIYRDAAVEPLMRALQSGRVTAVTRTDCRDEWQRVLHYPQFELDAVRRRDACSSYDTWFHEYPPPLQQRNVSIDALPRCGDPDDQKFLEL